MNEGGKAEGQELPTLETFKQQADELIQQAKEAERQKLEDIKKKANNTEELYNARKKDVELLESVHQTLQYFQEQEKQELLDEDGKEKLQELKNTVQSIRDHMANLDLVIQKLYSQPDITGEIQERALQEDKTVEERKKREKETEEILINITKEFEQFKNETDNKVKELENEIEGELSKKISAIKLEIKKKGKGVLYKEKKKDGIRELNQELNGIKDEIKKKLAVIENGAINFRYEKEKQLDKIYENLYFSGDFLEKIKKEKERIKKELKDYREKMDKETDRLWRIFSDELNRKEAE